jgi:hypothetical protein
MYDEKQLRPYLVQRMNLPYKGPTDTPIQKMVAANPFSFGGGLLNGGFKKEAMEILHKIFSYDYMGSSEFEWGDVPKSMKRMMDVHKGNVTGEVSFTRKVTSWQPRRAIKTTTTEYPVKIWYICKKGIESELKKLLYGLAQEDWKNMKEVLMFEDNLGKKDDIGKTVGWHDICNDFMFFTNEEMFKELEKIIVTREE